MIKVNIIGEKFEIGNRKNFGVGYFLVIYEKPILVKYSFRFNEDKSKYDFSFSFYNNNFELMRELSYSLPQFNSDYFIFYLKKSTKTFFDDSKLDFNFIELKNINKLLTTLMDKSIETGTYDFVLYENENGEKIKVIIDKDKSKTYITVRTNFIDKNGFESCYEENLEVSKYLKISMEKLFYLIISQIRFEIFGINISDDFRYIKELEEDMKQETEEIENYVFINTDQITDFMENLSKNLIIVYPNVININVYNKFTNKKYSVTFESKSILESQKNQVNILIFDENGELVDKKTLENEFTLKELKNIIPSIVNTIKKIENLPNETIIKYIYIENFKKLIEKFENIPHLGFGEVLIHNKTLDDESIFSVFCEIDYDEENNMVKLGLYKKINTDIEHTNVKTITLNLDEEGNIDENIVVEKILLDFIISSFDYDTVNNNKVYDTFIRSGMEDDEEDKEIIYVFINKDKVKNIKTIERGTNFYPFVIKFEDQFIYTDILCSSTSSSDYLIFVHYNDKIIGYKTMEYTEPNDIKKIINFIVNCIIDYFDLMNDEIKVKYVYLENITKFLETIKDLKRGESVTFPIHKQVLDDGSGYTLTVTITHDDFYDYLYDFSLKLYEKLNDDSNLVNIIKRDVSELINNEKNLFISLVTLLYMDTIKKDTVYDKLYIDELFDLPYDYDYDEDYDEDDDYEEDDYDEDYDEDDDYEEDDYDEDYEESTLNETNNSDYKKYNLSISDISLKDEEDELKVGVLLKLEDINPSVLPYVKKRFKNEVEYDENNFNLYFFTKFEISDINNLEGELKQKLSNYIEEIKKTINEYRNSQEKIKTIFNNIKREFNMEI
jgi:hypothetical protein